MSDELTVWHRCFWCAEGRINHGKGWQLCWITFTYGALRHERRRVRHWMKRHDPATGKRYGLIAAIKATAENTPSFDRMWDEEMEVPHAG